MILSAAMHQCSNGPGMGPEIIGDKCEDHRIIVIELKIVQVYQCVDDIIGMSSKVSEEVSVIVS